MACGEVFLRRLEQIKATCARVAYLSITNWGVGKKSKFAACNILQPLTLGLKGQTHCPKGSSHTSSCCLSINKTAAPHPLRNLRQFISCAMLIWYSIKFDKSWNLTFPARDVRIRIYIKFIGALKWYLASIMSAGVDGSTFRLCAVEARINPSSSLNLGDKSRRIKPPILSDSLVFHNLWSYHIPSHLPLRRLLSVLLTTSEGEPLLLEKKYM